MQVGRFHTRIRSVVQAFNCLSWSSGFRTTVLFLVVHDMCGGDEALVRHTKAVIGYCHSETRPRQFNHVVNGKISSYIEANVGMNSKLLCRALGGPVSVRRFWAGWVLATFNLGQVLRRPPKPPPRAYDLRYVLLESRGALHGVCQIFLE